MGSFLGRVFRQYAFSCRVKGRLPSPMGSVCLCKMNCASAASTVFFVAQNALSVDLLGTLEALPTRTGVVLVVPVVKARLLLLLHLQVRKVRLALEHDRLDGIV